MQGTIRYSFVHSFLCQRSFCERINSHHVSTVSFGVLFPWEEKSEYIHLKSTFRLYEQNFLNMLLFVCLFIRTELWQEALVSWNDIIVQWEPGLNDTMDETTNGKPAHSQTPPCPQPAGGPFPAGDQPGRKHKHPRHRKQERQNLWHRSVIGDIGGNQKVPWPVGMKKLGCWCGIHHLFQEKMVNTNNVIL